jgi:uncharacterized membrane protein YebE (DUF533 family)
MEPQIDTDTLLALAAIAWADGSIAPAEAAGIRSAARQLGLGPDELGRVEAALARRFDLGEVETLRMNRLSRLFTYAAASWIAGIDGAPSPAEATALGMLGERLGLSNVARERATAAARAIGSASGPGADAYDLVKLRSRLSASLSQVGDE